MIVKNQVEISTLGELKKSGYKSKTIKEELRNNLIDRLKGGKKFFNGIHGYEFTVIPDLERAILSKHNILFLGLRGQAKTRMARQMVDLMDEYIPVIEGSALNDDPLNPVSFFGKRLVNEMGDLTPVSWLHKSERYTEKLASPDVSVADLIGDVDPIKAINLKLNFEDERVLHYGLIPRSNRCIFVINELPDLQARIQVALFNILQEGDIQIRGFKFRVPLDIQFVFTANPEDYTNRGSIVTPLKDRIESQILTHYPEELKHSRMITSQEARITPDQKQKVSLADLLLNLIEQISIEARMSEYVDQKSGVSARMAISALENLYSAVELRILHSGEDQGHGRIMDLFSLTPSITGKIELVYEGEQEGSGEVALHLIGKAIRTQFPKCFPNPDLSRRSGEDSPYSNIANWFGKGNTLDWEFGMTQKEYVASLSKVPGLQEVVDKYSTEKELGDKLILMEFVLFGMAEYSLLSKNLIGSKIEFKDLLSGMLPGGGDLDNFDEEGY